MPTIWSLPVLSELFGVGLLIGSFFILKIGISERNKRIVALSALFVLIGIGLIWLGIWAIERWGFAFPFQ